MAICLKLVCQSLFTMSFVVTFDPMIHFILPDKTAAYEQVWIIGDHFVHESHSFMDRLFRIGDATPALGPESYVSMKYQTLIFSNSANASHMRSTLGRLRNLLVSVLNEYDRLPKYILLVIENDLFCCIKFEDTGVSELYSRIVHWLADEYHSIIAKHKSDLPVKAKKTNYPQLFWVALPYHQNFNQTGIQCHKFNQGMETMTSLHEEMHLLQIRRIWSNVDTSVTQAGIITEVGQTKYWCGIDEALEFWENGWKRNAATFRSDYDAVLHQETFKDRKPQINSLTNMAGLIRKTITEESEFSLSLPLFFIGECKNFNFV